MMLEQRFIQNIKTKNLFSFGDRLIVAVSGGVDSVVLCDLCHRNGLHFEMAHVNFGLRGEESDADAMFVKELSAKYKVTLHTKRVDTDAYCRENKLSVQVAARELRYAWFDHLLEKGGGYVLTAHHADDNVETVLMNFFRGTGIRGLRGIPERAGGYVRPLLSFTRAEIIGYAQHHQISWREDSSNASEKYTRNYFRNTIMPLVRQVFPDADKNISENARRFAEVGLLYQQAIEAHLKKLVQKKGNEWHIPVIKLKKTEPARSVLYEWIKRFDFTAAQLEDVLHLADAEHGKMVNSPTHRVIRNRDWLIFTPKKSSEATTFIISEDDTSINFPGGTLTLHKIAAPSTISTDTSEALLDSRLVDFPLILRKWKTGDYFYPLGMKKKKKVSRFLIDRKISPVQKENVWVLESAKRICWVVGMRIDDRFRITSSTKNVFEMKVRSEE